jgi:hypothetical protein
MKSRWHNFLFWVLTLWLFSTSAAQVKNPRALEAG